MKFAHLLDTLARANPEFQVLHTLYKQAKKALKRIQLAGIGAFVGPGAVAGTSAAPQQPVPSQQSSQQLGAAAVAVVGSWPSVHTEEGFATELVRSIRQLDETRCQLSAQCSERLTALQQTAEAPGTMDLHELYRDAVRFHGEVLLVMNWSLMAYTMCLKILKKHHKRTGLLLQAPELRDILSHPSWSTEGMAGLATEAEALVTQVQRMVLDRQEQEDAAPQLQPPSPELQSDAAGGSPADPAAAQPQLPLQPGVPLGATEPAPPPSTAVGRRRPAAPSGSSGSMLSGSSGDMVPPLGAEAAATSHARGAQGPGPPHGAASRGGASGTHRHRKKSHWDPDVVEGTAAGGSGAGPAPHAQHAQEDVDLSQYARHAAAQHESLRALQARHVIARLQQGAGGAAGGSSPNAARDACVLPHGDSPPPPVAPLLPPLEAVRAAADGAGMPPERPASAGQRSSPRDAAPMLQLADVPSWGSLELLSAMHTSSCDSDYEDDPDQDTDMPPANTHTIPLALPASRTNSVDAHNRMSIQGDDAGLDVAGVGMGQEAGEAAGAAGLQPAPTAQPAPLSAVALAAAAQQAEGRARESVRMRLDGATGALVAIAAAGSADAPGGGVVVSAPASVVEPLGMGTVPAAAPLSRHIATLAMPVPGTAAGGVSQRAGPLTVASAPAQEPSMSASGSCAPHARRGGAAGGSAPPSVAVSRHPAAAASGAGPGRLLPPRRPARIREDEEEVTSAPPATLVAASAAPAGSVPASWLAKSHQSGSAAAGAGPASAPVVHHAADVLTGPDASLMYQMRLAMQAWEHITTNSVTPGDHVPPGVPGLQAHGRVAMGSGVGAGVGVGPNPVAVGAAAGGASSGSTRSKSSSEET